jgi:hypothetical protein
VKAAGGVKRMSRRRVQRSPSALGRARDGSVLAAQTALD